MIDTNNTTLKRTPKVFYIVSVVNTLFQLILIYLNHVQLHFKK